MTETSNELTVDRKLYEIFQEAYDLYDSFERCYDPTNSPEFQVNTTIRFRVCFELFVCVNCHI